MLEITGLGEVGARFRYDLRNWPCPSLLGGGVPGVSEIGRIAGESRVGGRDFVPDDHEHKGIEHGGVDRRIARCGDRLSGGTPARAFWKCSSIGRMRLVANSASASASCRSAVRKAAGSHTDS